MNNQSPILEDKLIYQAIGRVEGKLNHLEDGIENLFMQKVEFLRNLD